jgi:hypothetical protein
MEAYKILQNKIQDLRFRGFGGTSIQMHRAIFSIRLQKSNLILALLLPLFFNFLVFASLDLILQSWHALFDFWLRQIAPEHQVLEYPIDLGRYLLAMPFPDFSAGAPSSFNWWTSLIVSAVIFLLTYFIPPDRFLPLTYILRACLLIQSTALAYFYFSPSTFPYDLPSYLGNGLVMGLFFLFLIPWILGFTYYVFNFHILQKIALTLLILVYFLLAFPMQYLFHGYLLSELSLLYLPLAYLVLGGFLDVMMFVAFYSWGMSWRWGELDSN